MSQVVAMVTFHTKKPTSLHLTEHFYFQKFGEHPFLDSNSALLRYRQLNSRVQLNKRPEPIQLVTLSLITSNYMAGYLLR